MMTPEELDEYRQALEGLSEHTGRHGRDAHAQSLAWELLIRLHSDLTGDWTDMNKADTV